METTQQMIKILSAFLTPTIAIVGIYMVVKNYHLELKKRDDVLYDRRLKFYKGFERLWKTTGPESEGATRMCLEWDDLEPWLQEASFLFGEEIIEHLKSYEGKSFQSSIRWVPDADLARPFMKYLKFK